MKLLSLILLTATTVASIGYQPSVVQAQDVEFYFGHGRDRDYRYDRGDRRERYDRGCSPREAMRDALRRGMKDPQIIVMDQSRIVIDGYGRRNEYTRLRLANREGCPRIG